MITEQRRKLRKRLQNKPQYTVWYESNDQGGFIIYAGIRGTDVKTYAGSATSRATLDYNMRKARNKFQLTVV